MLPLAALPKIIFLDEVAVVVPQPRSIHTWWTWLDAVHGRASRQEHCGRQCRRGRRLRREIAGRFPECCHCPDRALPKRQRASSSFMLARLVHDQAPNTPPQAVSPSCLVHNLANGRRLQSSAAGVHILTNNMPPLSAHQTIHILANQECRHGIESVSGILEPTPSLIEPLIMKHHIFLHEVWRSWGSASIVRCTRHCNTTCPEPRVHTLISHNKLSMIWPVPVHCRFHDMPA